MHNNSKLNTEHKISYLQMIQSSIERMSSISAIFKGFCATIITGVFAISFTEINKWVLFLVTIPVVCCLVADVYYFYLEKRFRILYDNVKNGISAIDFGLTPPKGDYKMVFRCLKSPSIYLFYPPLIFIIALIVILKFNGVI